MEKVTAFPDFVDGKILKWTRILGWIVTVLSIMFRIIMAITMIRKDVTFVKVILWTISFFNFSFICYFGCFDFCELACYWYVWMEGVMSEVTIVKQGLDVLIKHPNSKSISFRTWCKCFREMRRNLLEFNSFSKGFLSIVVMTGTLFNATLMFGILRINNTWLAALVTNNLTAYTSKDVFLLLKGSSINTVGRKIFEKLNTLFCSHQEKDMIEHWVKALDHQATRLTILICLWLIPDTFTARVITQASSLREKEYSL